MDSRLMVAAWNGNVETLYKMIEEDWRILNTASLMGGENPLHIACLAGHVHFVQELIKLMPGFAHELNQDGFSPLHIASAKGFVEIARELLRVDDNLCLIEGMDNRIPLHCAVTKGRVEVIKELISVNTDSIDHMTARGETALHLAVKNNQFKVFEVLVEHIKKVNKEGVLNMKDDQGNTILHLAVSRKLYQVVDLLVNEHVIPNGTMDLNLSNKRGLTPLDVLQLFQSEAGDRELEDILRRAGARTNQDVLSSTPTIGNTTDTSSNGQSKPHLPTQNSRLGNYFRYHRLEDSQGQMTINLLLVIAVLVVTATYQALQSPPGGFWQDDTDSHTAGKAIMATKNPVGYGIFVFFNTPGFSMSMFMIYYLTCGFTLRTEMLISTSALFITYAASLFAITPYNPINIIFFFFSLFLITAVWRLIIFLRYRFYNRVNTLSGIDEKVHELFCLLLRYNVLLLLCFSILTM